MTLEPGHYRFSADLRGGVDRHALGIYAVVVRIGGADAPELPTIPGPGVPEPGTLALVALGLAVLARHGPH